MVSHKHLKKARRFCEVLKIWAKIGQHSFDSFFGLAGDRRHYLKPYGVMIRYSRLDSNDL